MLQIQATDFENEVLKSNVPVLIDFSATWCGPCQMMGPVLKQLANEYEGKAKVLKIDLDEAMNIAEQYGVVSVPTMIFFQNGEEKDRLVGVTPVPVLKDKLDSFL